ncbi:protease [Xanthobacter sp. DSM 24535]|uniref:HdeD family acid-resistance protein n=1 Tax=Roseixanthobacter psychrophilus TaxID=3119917 RepID=UPI00372B2BAA
MGQIAFLLIGSESMRQRWFVMAGVGALLMACGLFLMVDAMDGVTLLSNGLLGFVFLLEGVFAIFATLTGRSGVSRIISALKAAVLIGLAYLIIQFPDANIYIVTVLFSAAFVFDGATRIATASIVRFRGWRVVIAWGAFEILLAALIAADWPIPRTKNIPFCVSLLLTFSGWVLIRMSLMLKTLEPEAAILTLPMFGARAWYDHAPILLGDDPDPKSTEPMTVHVWTPTGSADVSGRRVLLDRYIAAVDRQGMISTGHSALELPPNLYISHYPGHEIEQGAGAFMTSLRATADNDLPGRFQPSYAEERAAWCDADAHVSFRNFNARRLRAFWIGYRQENTYNLTNRNCSVAVASALDAALEGTLASRYPWLRLLQLLCDPDLWVAAAIRAHAEAMTWTPGLVLDYARALHRLVEPTELPWIERLKGALAFLLPKSKAAAS